jgi:homoserine dehydrogenase
VRLAFSAAVGGGSPMVETVREARRHGPIVEIEAILNGTCNFILDRTAQGASFEQALAEARRAGFAEEDPSSDLEGHDAAAKLRILAWEAFGVVLGEAEVARESLDGSVAARFAGAAVKQIGRCVLGEGGCAAEVTITTLDSDNPFGVLRGERNALRVVGAGGRVWTCAGRGAGRWPTAESVLADVADVRRAAARA